MEMGTPGDVPLIPFTALSNVQDEMPRIRFRLECIMQFIDRCGRTLTRRPASIYPGIDSAIEVTNHFVPPDSKQMSHSLPGNTSNVFW